jgi:phosphate uptake regulator
VDALYEQVYEELLRVMKSKPRVANQAIYLSRAAYNLKRVAERVTGVCEWVVFSITGTMGGQVVPLQPRPGGEPPVTHDGT